MIVGAVIVVIMAAVSATKGLVDPDYWWHVTAGRVILEQGVPATDPFSFTWGGQPWTPHEWLSELLLHGVAEWLGPAGVLVLSGAIAGAAIAVVAAATHRAGASTLAVALPAVLGAVVFVPYVTARPQAISWLFLAVELAILLDLRPERPARALWLVPLFVAWANLHGLYVIGLGVLGLYLVFTVAGRTPMAPARRWIVGAFAGAFLASMLTPAGPAGLLYPLRYVDGSDWGLANIAEWQSPDFHDPAHLAFLILIVAVAAAGGRGAPGWLGTLSVLGVAAGLLALRNAPLSALMAMPTLAFALEGLRGRGVARRPPTQSMALARRLMEIVMATIVAVAAWAILVPRDIEASSADATAAEFPVEATDLLRQRDPDARVLAEYGWAGWVIHELYPTGGRVFVDGRNDMYPEAILRDYSAVRAGDPGFADILDRHRVEWLLFPPETTITRGPAEAAGWCEAYRDERQVLLEPCNAPAR